MSTNFTRLLILNPLPRRAVLTALGATALAPTLGVAAPASSWLAYDRRLQRGLAEAADGRFEPGFERDLIELNNGFRDSQGRRPLTWDAGLARTARAHAADVAATGRFDHMTAEGFGPAARVGLLARDLVGAAGENIAMRRNASSAVRPGQIHDQWRTSPGHRANLLAPGFSHVGYGVIRRGAQIIAVGAYYELAARLAAPTPLRVGSVAEIAATLSRATPRILQFSVSEPGDDILTQTYVEGSQVVSLPHGTWQLRPHLSTGAHRYQVAWGPVFVVD